VDLEITPEPTPEEREAVIRALELERDPEPSAWQRGDDEDDGYATALLRQSRGATRA
jgi:hypothetical protein